MTRAASVYEFDDLDLDEPEIDNDLELYQVGSAGHIPPAADLTASPVTFAYVPVGTAGSQL